MTWEILDAIDRALHEWETTKAAHGLSALIETGKQILAEGNQ